MPCRNAVKTRNRLKFAGVPQPNETISAACEPKFTILWGRVEEVLLLNKFLPIVDTCLSCEDIARQSCGMVPRWRFFASFLHAVYSASCTQHISDMHSKFALRPHHVWKYGRHPISDRWDSARKKIRRRKKKGRIYHRMKIYWPALFHRAAIITKNEFLGRNSRAKIVYNSP